MQSDRPASCLEQEDTAVGDLREAGCEDTSGCAAADDDDVVHWPDGIIVFHVGGHTMCYCFWGIDETWAALA